MLIQLQHVVRNGLSGQEYMSRENESQRSLDNQQQGKIKSSIDGPPIGRTIQPSAEELSWINTASISTGLRQVHLWIIWNATKS